MPRSKECVIGIDLAIAIKEIARALALRVPEGRLGFRCPNCGEAVKTAKKSAKQGAHFEHLKRNVACKLSDPPRHVSLGASGRSPATETSG